VFKDFLIFPEYENTPDYDAIKDYVTTFGEDLESARIPFNCKIKQLGTI
jgi:hypothetical protein